MWAASTVWDQKVSKIFHILKTCPILHWKLDEKKSTFTGVSCVTCRVLQLPGLVQVFWTSNLWWWFFHSPPFLDNNRSTSHHEFPSHSPSLVNYWENESQYWNLSLLHILLEALFPIQKPYHPKHNSKLQSAASQMHFFWPGSVMCEPPPPKCLP